MKKKFLLICCLLLGMLAMTVNGAEDPLRGADLSRHLTGPEVEPGSLKGKVVFFEYWGYG